MWYFVRYVYNWLLTAFLALGCALLVLGTGALALLVVGAVISVIQHLLGFEPLLTQDRLYWPLVIVCTACGLGAILGELGLGATHPKSIRRMRDRP